MCVCVRMCRLSYALQQTWVVQSPVALAMGSAHYLAQWLSTLAANLDEDSRLRGRLTWAADQLRLWRDSLARRYRMRYLRLADQLRVRAVLEQAQAWLGGMEKAAARKLKQIQDARRPRDPYEQWEESLDKRDVTVVWRRDEGEGGTDEVLGIIKVDVDMPISILRQKIRRRLREPLNARNGEGFIFLVRPLQGPPPRLSSAHLARAYKRVVRLALSGMCVSVCLCACAEKGGAAARVLRGEAARH